MAVHPTLPAPLRVGEVRRLNVSAEHATVEPAEPSGSPGVGDRWAVVGGEWRAGRGDAELARAAREKFGGDALADFVGAHTAYLERISWHRTP